MRWRDAASQQVEREPAPIALEYDLVADGRCAEGLPSIFGLNECRGGIDGPHGAHRQHGAAHLVEETVDERAIVARVRVPMSVQRAEPGGGERFVDGCIGVDPWISLGDGTRERGELRGKLRVEERGVGGAAAVMDETEDR